MVDQTNVAEEIIESGDSATTTPSDKPSMAVKVYAPFQVYFEGDAYSVSAVSYTYLTLPTNREV